LEWYKNCYRTIFKWNFWLIRRGNEQ